MGTYHDGDDVFVLFVSENVRAIDASALLRAARGLCVPGISSAASM